MPDNSSQPTILVKKSDGTSVRMTMDEFKAYKAGLGQAVIKVEDKAKVVNESIDKTKVEAKVDNDDKSENNEKIGNLQTDNLSPKKVEPGELVVIGKSPVPKIKPSMIEVKFIDSDVESQEPRAKSQEVDVKKVVTAVKEEKKMVQLPVQRDDFAEAMTAPAEKELKHAGAVTMPNDTAQKVEEVMSKITIPLRSDLRGRLQSLLQSRLKDVRTDEQVLEYLTKLDSDGGVGLTVEDAKYVLDALHMVMPGKKPMPKPVVSAPKPVAPAPAPQPTAVVPSALVEKKVETSVLPLAPKPAPVGQARAVLHDVTMPPAPTPTPAVSSAPKANTGPLEELSRLTLNDLHRLGKLPAEATARLLSKFQNWKSESYIFYMDARDAWRKSPLFAEYQKAMVDSLKTGKTIADVLQSGNGLKLEEFMEVVKLNAKLN